jgi:hypothetical protein
MMNFTHGLSATDYCNIIETIRSAVDLLVEGGRDPNCENAVAVIARTGMLTAEDAQTVRCIAEEMFGRSVH